MNTRAGRIAIYDTTLRDGSQMEGISFSVEDKLKLARKLDELGVDYIEGGWPGSNPKDVEFFARSGKLELKHARLVAFGSTRRPYGDVENDHNLRMIVEAGTPAVTLVGKTWDMQVGVVLNCSLEENLAMLADSVAWCKSQGREVFFDAEHYFDGWRANPEYALACILAAAEAGADAVVLCDTNGGRMPEEVAAGVEAAVAALPGTAIGIHTHNDSETGVANALAGVRVGATHVQGTINGYGERTGNANLCSIIANLELKYGYETIGREKLQDLTRVSHYFAEVANMSHDGRLPYVGAKAFTHKAGLHVNAVEKAAETYEHLPPEVVGNTRRIMISELSGKSNILYKMRQFGLEGDVHDHDVRRVIDEVKRLENEGFQFEDAEASFELLVLRARPEYEPPFRLLDFVALTERRSGGEFLSEATVKLMVGGETMHTVADGDGPVNALDRAMRKALAPSYPELEPVVLTDYKVRVLDNEAGTAATVRVWIQSSDGRESWNTVGSSFNVIEASWLALADSLEYPLRRVARRST